MRTADHIACNLTRARGPFPYRRYVCVANVDWGLRLNGEADLVALAPSNWLYEIEIKISAADLKRDAGKLKHRVWEGLDRPQLVRGFYYAMPDFVWGKVEGTPAVAHAGVIVIGGDWSPFGTIIRKPKLNASARKLTEAERFQLARLGTMRYWTRLSHKLDADAAC